MATCRDLIKEAVLAFEGIGFGDDLLAGEVAYGLTMIQREIRRLHEGRGPLLDVDVTADYTAGENERVGVQDGYSPEITLPNSIMADPDGVSDYGFASSTPPRGSTEAGNGTTLRAPRDGARVEIVPTTTALYFYRSDTNAWVECGALTIDGPMPLNESYLTDFAALLAVRMAPRWPGRASIIPPASLQREAAEARLRLSYRHGVTRAPAVGDYF